MRSGPGRQYPILWIYQRRELPVEVTAEYGAWRRVRDSDGTVGWMHGNLLSGRRTALISGRIRDLKAEPTSESPTTLRAEPGVIGEIRECEARWCRLSIQGTSAWLPEGHFWGAYKDETLN